MWIALAVALTLTGLRMLRNAHQRDSHRRAEERRAQLDAEMAEMRDRFRAAQTEAM